MDYKNPAPNSSYVNKDFQRIFPEMLDLVKKLTYKWDPSISNESDPGVILLKLNAIINDKSSYNIDKGILEFFPETVSQEQDAYSMFRQLGYYPKWFISAKTDVIFKFKQSEDDPKTGAITIPIFTQLCDESRSLVYTITGGDVELNLTSEGFSNSVEAIQGSIHDYTVNGDSLIRFSDLDSKRRLYFDELNVAQNGIFIYNDGSSPKPENFWQITDNIYAEELNSIPGGSSTNFFSFGLSRDLGRCYVEFAEDIEECIGGGIHIKYLTSDGFDGNAPARAISRLFDNLTLTIHAVGSSESGDDANTVNLSEENLIIRNDASSTNGRDSENIDEMYIGYKRTVGTFNTLVAIRDYLNFVLKTGLVSNGVVCDRLNDIQSSYKVVTIDNDINIVKSEVIDDEMTAYDLRMYLNKLNTSPLTSQDAFQSTFDLLPSSSMLNRDIISLMQDSKCVLHDFKNILPSSTSSGKVRFCGFLINYDISCKITPQYELTSSQKEEIDSNIRNNIYKNLNSGKLVYGTKTEYEEVKDIILNADERIKSVSLRDFVYTVSCILWDGFSFNRKTVDTREANEIIARSILAGITQGIDVDSRYEYNLNMCIGNDYQNSVASIEPIANISWTPQSDKLAYTINSENENIVFYAPAKSTVRDFSTYTKYDYNMSSVVANSEYTLNTGEYINFKWTEDGQSKYANYSSGTTIKPSFNLAGGTHTDESLGSTNSVAILEGNEITIESGRRCYWILNTKTVTDNGFVYTLFNRDRNEYILNYGEYFVYTDRDATSIEILGSGTRLIRVGANQTDWTVPVIDPEDVLENGANANIEWFAIPNSYSVNVTEMRLATFGSGTTIYISNTSETTGGSWIGNTEYNVSGEIIYNDGSGNQSLEIIDQDGWRGVSRLNVKMSPSISQELTSGQSIVIKDVGTIYGPSLVKSSAYLDFPGSKSINVTNYDVADNSFSNISLMNYSESEWKIYNASTSSYEVASNVVGYGDTWKVTIPYSESNASYNFSIENRLTKGKYMFSISDSNADIDLSKVVVYRGGNNISTPLSSSETCAYFNFSVDPDEQSNVSTTISLERISTESAKYDESIIIGKLIKYSDGSIDFGNSSAGSVYDVLTKLDSKNEFDYGYTVNPDTEIKDPTDPESFFDPNHIFNKFTLPHVSNISVQITNVKGR